MKTQQRNILKKEISITGKENNIQLDNLFDFLKAYEQASKSTQIPLPTLKIEIGSQLSKNNLFDHFHEDIRENSNSQICLSFRFARNDECVCSIKKFNIHGDHLTVAEIVHINIHKSYSLYKKRHLIGYKCGFCESDHDI